MRVKKMIRYLKKEIREMVWSDGAANVYYYYHPGRSSTVCAIKKTYDLYGRELFVVWWSGWGVCRCTDLDVLKKEVEGVYRTKMMRNIKNES